MVVIDLYLDDANCALATSAGIRRREPSLLMIMPLIRVGDDHIGWDRTSVRWSDGWG